MDNEEEMQETLMSESNLVEKLPEFMNKVYFNAVFSPDSYCTWPSILLVPLRAILYAENPFDCEIF